ncbi:PH domain-containing protein [Actinomyces capricornis]|uniref:PH domain-containing protein n=1 Tax=Actinomyces capricornis TaxID=2755559 RepID=UPI001CC4B22A|nr:PH domain-containing protein [Actinomyces capricornis]MDO5063653.1 PH domain-containing protein [Actinomyces bowdenii]
MPVPREMLSRDEVVVRHTRTHIKIILWRIIAQVLIVVAAVVASIYVPGSWAPWGLLAIWIVALVVSIPVFILPWLAWWNTTYTITTKRVITRSGILSRTGHDLPLSRISDVQQDKSVSDRFFGCGTLALQTSSDDPLRLEDVPQVEMVQVEISNLLFNDPQGAIDADPRS